MDRFGAAGPVRLAATASCHILFVRAYVWMYIQHIMQSIKCARQVCLVFSAGDMPLVLHGVCSSVQLC